MSPLGNLNLVLDGWRRNMGDEGLLVLIQLGGVDATWAVMPLAKIGSVWLIVMIELEAVLKVP